jgi:hypothetical protein
VILVPVADTEEMRALAVTLVVLSAIAGGGWAIEKHARAAKEGELSAVATELAGRPVHVRCQTFWRALIDVDGRLGDVPFPGGHPASYTHVTRKMCGLLARFRSSAGHPELACLTAFDWSRFDGRDPAASACSRRANDTAEALMTLAHESMHLRGWADEATAQCYGVQQLAFTVERLGGSATEGKAVADYMFSLQKWLPSDYQSAECAPRGALDLHPETPEFPSESPPALLPARLCGPQL